MLTHFDISFANDAGHTVLNIPDAPQSMTLSLRNPSDTQLMMTGVSDLVPDGQFHVRLRFRPHSLHDLASVRLAPSSHAAWRLTAYVDPDNTQVLSLRLMRRIAWRPDETEVVLLDGISAEPQGGTRDTNIEVSYANFELRHGTIRQPIEGHHLIRARIARSRVGAFDAARHIRTGSSARFGPLTAGFVGGPAVLADGEALSQLRLRLVNTSSSPIRLSGDDDAASRIELEYRTSVITAPWGLLHGQSDHLTATLYEPDEPDEPDEPQPMMVEASHWEIDGTVVRCRKDHAWGPGEYLDIDLDVHASAPPGDVQLIVRVVDIASMDDGELILLAHVAPLAVFADSVATTAPIELWGGSAVEFRASGYLGRDHGALATASLRADTDGALVISGTPEVRVADRLHLTMADEGEGGGQLVIGPTDASNLRLGAHADYTWIQPHGLKALRIDPSGNSVSIGPVAPSDGMLTVHDRIDIHGMTAGPDETLAQRNARSHLALSRGDQVNSIESSVAPLAINQRGQPVTIGDTSVPVQHRVGIGGGLHIVGRRNEEHLLTLSRQPLTGEPVDVLTIGQGVGFSFIDTPRNQHLIINSGADGSSGTNQVVIGSAFPRDSARLTVDGGLAAGRVDAESVVTRSVATGSILTGSVDFGLEWKLETTVEYDGDAARWILRAVSLRSGHEVELADEWLDA